jgi:hypothetical protein
LNGTADSITSDYSVFETAYQKLGGGVGEEGAAGYLPQPTPALSGTPLVSTPTLRDGCDDGQSQWVVFVAPTTATYGLAVLPSQDANEDSGPFTVTYQLSVPPTASNKSSGFGDSETLSGWYPRAVDAQASFLTDATFFASTKFQYAATGPYSWQSCGDANTTPTMYGPTNGKIIGVTR